MGAHRGEQGCREICVLDFVLFPPSHHYGDRRLPVSKVEVSTPHLPCSGDPASPGYCILLSPSVCRGWGVVVGSWERPGEGLPPTLCQHQETILEVKRSPGLFHFF